MHMYVRMYEAQDAEQILIRPGPVQISLNHLRAKGPRTPVPRRWSPCNREH
jgi:hypothetical protein